MGFQSSGAHSVLQRNPLTKNVGSASTRRLCGATGTDRPSVAGMAASSSTRTQLSGGVGSVTSTITKSGDGGKRFRSQSLAAVNLKGPPAADADDAAATFASKRGTACGSFVLKRARASAVNSGALNSCGSKWRLVC